MMSSHMMSSQAQHLADLLQQGCAQLSLTLTDQQIAQLITYTMTLEKWNQTYNLTAVPDSESMLKRHVIDALSVVTPVAKYSPTALADIGTGGGVPGIILAIALPELTVYLVESIGKKCRFLRHVTSALGLSQRVHVVQQRVEQWQPAAPLSVVICRAFTSLNNFTTITHHLGDEQTTWLAMKSDQLAKETAQLSSAFTLFEDNVLTVPFESAERHLLVIKKSNIQENYL